MIYIVFAALLFMLLLGYFRLAKHFHIVDTPNNRSSHTAITIRGGGIVFPFAALLYAAFFHEVSNLLIVGILLISIVSFWDDIQNLPNKIRLFVHLLAVSTLLVYLNGFNSWPLWLIIVVYILIIGTLNAYNFMDGINGITGVYSFLTLGALLYVNNFIVSFIDNAFIISPILACLVFLFFNFRTKAKCFAGDVGSVSIAFWIIALLAMAMIKTDSLSYILFLAVYGVDAVLTIMHRLVLKQNIFEAHRLHFYQILANERGVSHLLVSVLYGVVQLIINVLILSTDFSFLQYTAFILVPLTLLYFLLKPKMMSNTLLS